MSDNTQQSNTRRRLPWIVALVLFNGLALAGIAAIAFKTGGPSAGNDGAAVVPPGGAPGITPGFPGPMPAGQGPGPATVPSPALMGGAGGLASPGMMPAPTIPGASVAGSSGPLNGAAGTGAPDRVAGGGAAAGSDASQGAASGGAMPGAAGSTEGPVLLQGGGGDPNPAPAPGAGGFMGSTPDMLATRVLPGQTGMSVQELTYWLYILRQDLSRGVDKASIPKLRSAIQQWYSSVVIIGNGELALTEVLSDAQKEKLMLAQFTGGSAPPSMEVLQKRVHQAAQIFTAGSASAVEVKLPSDTYRQRPWRSATPLAILVSGVVELARSETLSPDQLAKLPGLFSAIDKAFQDSDAAAVQMQEALGDDGLKKVQIAAQTAASPSDPPPMKPWVPFVVSLMEAILTGTK